MTGTKKDIFLAAIDLFAAKGYANVSVRDIAAVVKINAASIYNHFPSKEAILGEAYQFYRQNYYGYLPALEEYIRDNADMSPYDIWREIFIYPADLLCIMNKIVTISIDEAPLDRRAYDLIHEVFIDVPQRYIGSLLEDMVSRGIIEPVDTKIITSLVSSYNLYASIRMNYGTTIPPHEWEAVHKFIFNSIRLKDKTRF